MWKYLEKQLFFRVDMAGLGKYCMGGYGRIGVYRVIIFRLGLNTICNTKNRGRTQMDAGNSWRDSDIIGGPFTQRAIAEVTMIKGQKAVLSMYEGR